MVVVDPVLCSPPVDKSGGLSGSRSISKETGVTLQPLVNQHGNETPGPFEYAFPLLQRGNFATSIP